VAAIAAEKAGVITDATRHVVAARQDDPAAGAAIAAAARAHGSRLHAPDDGTPPAAGGTRAPLAPGMGALNAELGLAAAGLLLDLAGRPPATAAGLDAALRSVHLPGRLSRHGRGGQEWIVDCATNPPAIAAAIAHATATIGPPSAVLTFIPRHRDEAPLLDALRDQRVVRVPGGPSTGGPGGGAAMRLDAIDLDALGPRVLALGPVYFAGELLATLDVHCERSFTVNTSHVADGCAQGAGRDAGGSVGVGSVAE
jgi:dihydrofolate synthase/folylpolyglutamate synthase